MSENDWTPWSPELRTDPPGMEETRPHPHNPGSRPKGLSWPAACAATFRSVLEPAARRELGAEGARRFFADHYVTFDQDSQTGLPRPTFHARATWDAERRARPSVPMAPSQPRRRGLRLREAWRQLQAVNVRIAADAARHDGGGLPLAHAWILQNTKAARIRRSDARAGRS